MEIELTDKQLEDQKIFKEFTDNEIAPYADRNDNEERTPPETIEKLANKGYLGFVIPEEHGGSGGDMITYGLLCEEIGRGSSSILSLLTVQGMTSLSILRWGDDHQIEKYLSGLAKGEMIGAFGLTEPNIGSDANNVETVAELRNGKYILNGRKKWISFGQIADIFLILAQCNGKPTTFIVEKNTPGFSVHPLSGLMGFRSAMIAELHLNECAIPEENLLGKIGFGFSYVVNYALDFGRYNVGWGCVGLIRAALEASLLYTQSRKQFGALLRKHQLIQQMITDMITDLTAARMLSYQAGYLKDSGDPRTIMETSIAKYFASRAAVKASGNALQIHGANGTSSEYPVQRYFRDAKIMEIIEGSTQMQQMIISRYGYQHFI